MADRLDDVRAQFDREAADAAADTALLADVEAFLARFVVYPSAHARVAHVLWIAHTHLMDAWESTPRLAFLSPEPASGKSRSLEVTELLVPRPVSAVSATPAYLFRKVSDKAGPPTILYDEIDTVFGPKAKENEEVRGMLNAGHRRGAMAGRCVVRGKTVETEELPAYCAVALAGLGNLPDTILTRAVVVRMRRRAPGEAVEPYRRRIHSPEGFAVRERLERWASLHRVTATGAYPSMPAGVEDRAADVWEALLTVADAAGGDWPRRGREAAVSLVSEAGTSTPSLGVRLLADLRQVFSDADKLTTQVILGRLVALEEAPWGDLRGKPLDARRLSQLLRAYDVRPEVFRLGEETFRGYVRANGLVDAWARYLGPPPQAPESVTAVTTATPPINGAYAASLCEAPVTDVSGVTRNPEANGESASEEAF